MASKDALHSDVESKHSISIQVHSFPSSKVRSRGCLGGFVTLAAIGLFSLAIASISRPSTRIGYQPGASGHFEDDVCPQTSPITPVKHSGLLRQLESEFAKPDFKDAAFSALGGAVRVPTEMFDDLPPPGTDPRWDVFAQFHNYLNKTFPNVHKTLQKTTVNTFALVYHWQGSNSTLKPLLLTAHQDVVPVDPSTVDEWINSPFSGIYDGQWIWGRGSCDDKSGLIGQLLTLETLIANGFQPERSIVLAYGIDEERGGIEGATAIRDYLLKTYGKNAFALLIDEGGGIDARDDLVIAAPAVAEKGHFDLRLEVSSPGGHSSVPPQHTTIGLLAALIVQLEANPFEPHLHRGDPYWKTLQCQAAFDEELDSDLRNLIHKSRSSDKALKSLEKELFKSNQAKALAGTTQATDIIHGGVKTNALPESAFAIINHRIDEHSTVSAVKTHIVDTLIPAVKKYNLSLDAFSDKVVGFDEYAAAGHVKLSDAWGTALEPAPVTPSTGSPAFDLLSGTIISVTKTSKRWDNPENLTVIVAPSIMTDTRYYWNLTPHIFRYNHISRYDRYNGAHTVNEALYAEGLIDLVRFFTTIILNVDETKTLD
ncbi:carboxypeptidase S [Panus rudis PR-1116 ss-1]|nr:carboxypeptidase S [Panus rudis PR-1116 ss-1]